MWCEYMKLLDKEKIEDSVMWSKKKELGKELEEMCNLSQYIKEKGIMQGRKEGRKQGIVVGCLLYTSIDLIYIKILKN